MYVVISLNKTICAISTLTYIHTTHALSPNGEERHLRYSSEKPTFYQNYLAMSNTADVTGGKPIAVYSQSISDVNAINPLVTIHDIHGRKREVLFFSFVPDTTRDWDIIAFNQLKI
jgi:hypothetical protein